MGLVLILLVTPLLLFHQFFLSFPFLRPSLSIHWFASCAAMKTDRRYLSKAKEIKDKASGAKKGSQLVVTRVAIQVEAGSKKRKRHLVSGDSSEPRALEVDPTHPVAPSSAIPIVELDGDGGSSSPPLAAQVQVASTQVATPLAIS